MKALSVSLLIGMLMPRFFMAWHFWLYAIIGLIILSSILKFIVLPSMSDGKIKVNEKLENTKYHTIIEVVLNVFLGFMMGLVFSISLYRVGV